LALTKLKTTRINQLLS